MTTYISSLVVSGLYILLYVAVTDNLF